MKSKVNDTVLFETNRLQIIKYSVDRLDEIFHIYQDSDIIKYTMKDGNAKSKDELLKGVASYNAMYDDNQGRWLIIDKATNTAIGFVGIFYIEKIGKTELSYALIKAARSKGFATEALVGLKQYATEVLNLKEICSLIRIDNTSSENVAKRAGLKYQDESASLWGYDFKSL
jgi:ribosomal-protein-alanine N-acetyltransferase